MAQHDWLVLAVPGVMDVVERAVHKVASHYEVEEEDLLQEALIRVTDTSTNLPECVNELGLLQYRLEQDLSDLTEKQVRQRHRHTSFEERYEEAGDIDAGTWSGNRVALAMRNQVSGYTTDLIEQLLPAVWDESFCYGMRAENAPDDDMPRGSTNKSTGNTLAAHIADIKAGWKHSPLTQSQRVAVFLTYAVDYRQEDIAPLLNVSRWTVSRLVSSGVQTIADHLNYGKEPDLLDLINDYHNHGAAA